MSVFCAKGAPWICYSSRPSRSSPAHGFSEDERWTVCSLLWSASLGLRGGFRCQRLECLTPTSSPFLHQLSPDNGHRPALSSLCAFSFLLFSSSHVRERDTTRETAFPVSIRSGPTSDRRSRRVARPVEAPSEPRVLRPKDHGWSRGQGVVHGYPFDHLYQDRNQAWWFLDTP